MSQYTIKAVGDPREWESQKFGSRFLAYPLDLQDEDGKLHAGVEWSRKPDSDAPKVGDTVHGSIQGGQHGDRLKVDWDAMKGGGEGSFSAKSNGKGNWQPDSQRDPEKVARIARSHALTNAINLLVADDRFNAASKEDKQKAIRSWSGWIEEQVALAATEVSLGAKPLAANGGAGDSQTPAPAAVVTENPDDRIPF